MTGPDDKQAMKRYYILSILRLCGAIILTVGLAVIANGFQGWPIETGYLLFAIGAFTFILLPALLAKKWKSPPEK